MRDKIGRRDILGAFAAVGRPLLVNPAEAAAQTNDSITSASASEPPKPSVPKN